MLQLAMSVATETKIKLFNFTSLENFNNYVNRIFRIFYNSYR